MEKDTSFNRGVLAGSLLMIGGQAAHWFMTSGSHPDATTLRAVGVAVQGAVGFAGALWLFIGRRRLSPMKTS
jgi:hypothetical protein